jgi:hypothetical protein
MGYLCHQGESLLTGATIFFLTGIASLLVLYLLEPFVGIDESSGLFLDHVTCRDC